MLTSHKVENAAPTLLGQPKAEEGQALPQGLKFSNVFSAMFGEDYRKVNATASERADFNASLTSIKGVESVGLGSIDFASLSSDELRALLPPGLQGLADLDKSALNQLSTTLQNLKTDEDMSVDAIDMSEIGELTSLMASGEKLENRDAAAIAAKVHELLGIEMPKAQITSELDRRSAAHLSKAVANSLQQDPPSESDIQLKTDSVIGGVVKVTDAFKIDESLPGSDGLDIQSSTMPAVELVEDTALLDESLNEIGYSVVDAPQIMESDDIADSEVNPTVFAQADVVDINDKFGTPQSLSDKAKSVTEIEAIDDAVAETIELSGLDVNNAVSANGMAAMSVETAVNASQNSQGVRVVQPQVSGTAQTNYQVSWGASSESSAQATMSDTQTASQNSGGQSNSNQPQLAQQQMMQVQEQKTQALAQQNALKVSDELAAQIDRGETGAGLELNASDRRAQLPPGLQSINVPVKSPQWGQSVAHRVTFMANNQIQQAQINLNPEKLGPIQIKLHVDRDQQVHVSVTAQSGTTREAIEAAVPRLKEMLEQSGLNLASVDVSDQKQFAQDQNSEQEHSATAQGSQALESNLLDDEEDTNSAIVSDNLVDYYA